MLRWRPAPRLHSAARLIHGVVLPAGKRGCLIVFIDWPILHDTVGDVLLAAVFLSVLLFVAPQAAALSACTAGEIMAQDAGCPPTGVCTITQSFTVANGCVLDFAGRDVVVGGTGVLKAPAAALTIRAASLALRAGAFLDARGQASSGAGSQGGSVTIETTGAVDIQKSGTTRARIDVSGTYVAGAISIRAGGPITIGGRLGALQLVSSGGGGQINLETSAAIATSAGSEILATGGTNSMLPGGKIRMAAGTSIDLGDLLDVSGSQAGSIELTAGTTLVVRGLKGNGMAAAGEGGGVALVSGRDLSILGQILLRGSSSDSSEGGAGGAVTLKVAYGDLIIAGGIYAEGMSPDGDGGNVEADVNGALQVLAGATISARSNGRDGVGGGISLSAATTLSTAAPLDVSGGADGGSILVESGGDMTLAKNLDARGRYSEGSGGDITVTAGKSGPGALTVQSDLDASGGACSVDGCGEGGSVDVSGCFVQVSSTGRLLARASGIAGYISILAREGFRVDGTVNATKTQAAGADGAILFSYPPDKPPVLRVGGVTPEATFAPMARCTESNRIDCLMPCPACGDGSIDFPETCDDGGVLSCDGCSRFCVAEICDPAALCATECNPGIGCPPLPSTPCGGLPTATPTAPAATKTATQVFTVTPTPTVTLAPGAPTWTVTRTPTGTGTHTNTPAPTVSATATVTSSSTATRSPSLTPTATVSPTRTETPSSQYDAVITVPRPLLVNLGRGGVVAKAARVRVINGSVTDPVKRLIRLVVDEGDCPRGVLVEAPDFNSTLPGAQDTALLAGGQVAYASIPLRFDPEVFQPINRKSPRRCSMRLHAAVVSAGNVDPSPDNNTAILELNVVDKLVRSAPAHQTAIVTVKPLSLRISPRKTSVSHNVRFLVSNADQGDVAGHAIRVVASDGDCPTGTLSLPAFHQPNALPANETMVKSMKNRMGRVTVTVQASEFAGSTRKSPRRCTALLVASGPAGDSDLSNNVTALSIDVVTQGPSR